MKRDETNGSRDSGFRIKEFLNPSGRVAFRVSGWLDNKRIRQNYKTHEEALARKTQLGVRAANVSTAGQTVFTRLTPEQVKEAEAAFSMIEKLRHGSVLGAVEFYRLNYRDPLRRISVMEAAN